MPSVAWTRGDREPATTCASAASHDDERVRYSARAARISAILGACRETVPSEARDTTLFTFSLGRPISLWLTLAPATTRDHDDDGHAGGRGDGAHRSISPPRHRHSLVGITVHERGIHRRVTRRPAVRFDKEDRKVRHTVRGHVIHHQVSPRARHRTRRRRALLQHDEGRGLREAVRAMAEGRGRRAVPMRANRESMQASLRERTGGSMGDDVRPGKAAVAPRSRRGVARGGHRALRHPGQDGRAEQVQMAIAVSALLEHRDDGHDAAARGEDREHIAASLRGGCRVGCRRRHSCATDGDDTRDARRDDRPRPMRQRRRREEQANMPRPPRVPRLPETSKHLSGSLG